VAELAPALQIASAARHLLLLLALLCATGQQVQEGQRLGWQMQRQAPQQQQPQGRVSLPRSL
jgi:hypothetical protein